MNTSFLDGPAVNVSLELGRAPAFLRVVQNSAGAWDALDQLDDSPTEQEIIYVYLLDGDVSVGIACSRGRGGGCRRFWHADYRYYPEQPSQEKLRDEEFWKQWTHQQWERIECKPRGVA